MPIHSRNPLPESVTAHSEAEIAQGSFFATKLVKTGDTVKKGSTHPNYAQIFPVSTQKNIASALLSLCNITV